MEKIRRKLVEQAKQDGSLYPEVTGIRGQTRSAPEQAAHRPNAVIPQSIGSDTSDDTPSVKVATKPRTPREVIELSDSEGEVPQREAQPLGTHPLNTVNEYPTAQAPKPRPPTKPMVPIHVPSNKDVAAAPAADYETFDMRAADNVHDPQMSAVDTEKAIHDLVSGAFGEIEVDVSLEDATVDDLREGIALLPHQIVSRRWMADRESGKKTGGILADDMGLGKTIQTIVRILEGRATRRDEKDGWSPTTLVVCPVAVVSQWASEIKKMTSRLLVIEHHGPNRSNNPRDLEGVHVVVTSYSTIASEYGAYKDAAERGKSSKKIQRSQGSSDDDSDSGAGSVRSKRPKGKQKKDALFRVSWLRVVLDEAHNIKNRNTKAASACCALEAKYRWCLTGTPMQNGVEELYSLFKFLRVKPLNDWPTFNTQIAQPVKANRTVRAMKRLHVVLSAVMLRRTKDTLVNGKPIIQLPERLVEIVDCEFDEEERAFYGTVNELVQNRLNAMERQGGAAKNYTSMLVLLLRLRQACNHPSLVSEDYTKDKEAVEPVAAKSQEEDDADDLAEQLADMELSTVKHCQMCHVELAAANAGENCTACTALVVKAKRNCNADLPPDSAKTRKILEILQEIDERSRGEEKTIIFSQFTSMLDIVEPFLKAEGIRYVRYDGSMNKAQREQALDTIKKEGGRTRVILISFKAGSTGLNLSCCNNVILVDLWWNPALEDQAFDRAHRFGQKRDVHIHKLCVPDTVEQRILELQEKKRELAKAALSGDRMKNMRLGADELAALFRHGAHDDDD